MSSAGRPIPQPDAPRSNANSNTTNRAVRAQRSHADLLGWPGFDYRNWQNAAQFCADNKINLDETWSGPRRRSTSRSATPHRDGRISIR
jgi:hypothetical protein